MTGAAIGSTTMLVVPAATEGRLGSESSGERFPFSFAVGLGLPPKGFRRERRVRLSGFASGLLTSTGGGGAELDTETFGVDRIGGRTTSISCGGFTTNSSATCVTSISALLVTRAGGFTGSGNGLAVAITNGLVAG